MMVLYEMRGGVYEMHTTIISVSFLDLQHNKRDVIKPTTSASMKTLQCKL